MLKFYFGIAIVLFFSCSNEKKEPEKSHDLGDSTVVEDADSSLILKSYCDSVFIPNGLVDVQQLNPRIIVDLRYATSSNFLRQVLYDTLQAAYLQKEVAERLSRCQHYLDSIKPGYRLKVFDAVRPIQVQQLMWDALDSIPVAQRGKFVSNPRLGSVHNFGSAVDLTICDSQGKELDMGAGYDDFRPIAFPSKESFFLRSGELTQAQVDNRKLLREVMRSQKFVNIPSEWWHFNAFSRLTAEYKFPAMLNESGSFEKRRSASNWEVTRRDSSQVLPMPVQEE